MYRNLKIDHNDLEVLVGRFNINNYDEDVIKICAKIEKAHWDYIDNYKNAYNLKISFEQFAEQIWKYVPYSRKGNVKDAIKNFNK